MKHTLIAALAATLLMGSSALAQGPDSRPAPAPRAEKAFVFEGDPYLLELDPTGVALADVERPLVVEHEGRELRFASKESLAAFKQAPERYLAKVDAAMIADQLPYYPLMTCPISGDELGGEMGDPVDVVYKNRLVRLCCKMCIKKFKADPDKVIAELNAAAIKQQARSYPFKTCLVSGEDLEEGEIVDRVVSGRLVRMCCKMCTKKLAKNPAKFVHEIDAARTKAARKAGDKDGAGEGERHEGREHGEHGRDHDDD